MSSTSFRDLGLSEPVLQGLDAAGYEHPTPVQAAAVPALLARQDVIIQAQTGTGKTAAFALPILDIVDPTPGEIQALVLAPTRELAAQVARETELLGQVRGIKACAIYGGAGFEPQIEALKTAQVVVATPGRLLDHLRRRNISLNNIRIFGLDEADEMLSMGFEKDVFDVVSFLPARKQCFVCSATINDSILRLANAFLVDPSTIDLSSDQIGARSVEHRYFAVDERAKLEALRRVLPTWAPDGAIVFANTKVATFRIHEALAADDLPVGVINGDLPQSEREKALARMRDDRTKYLVATDVAARGIDISGLPAVVNYDMPDSPDNYVHRTGRTGRAGQFGSALSLVTPADISVFHYLEKFYRIKQRETPLPDSSEVSRIRANRFLENALDGLDADNSLPYADYLAAAQHLGSAKDGTRSIAKLIAFFRTHNGQATIATPSGEEARTSADKAPEFATPPQDSPAPIAARDDAEQSTAAILDTDDAADAPAADAPAVEAQAAAPRKSRRSARKPADDTAKKAEKADLVVAKPETAKPETAKPKSVTDRADRPEAGKSEAEEPDTFSDQDTADAADIHAWLDANSGLDGRERMRSTRAVASGVGMPMRRVRFLADHHHDLEVTGDRRSMIRILDGAPPTESSAPAAKPAAEPAEARETPAAPARRDAKKSSNAAEAPAQKGAGERSRGRRGRAAEKEPEAEKREASGRRRSSRRDEEPRGAKPSRSSRGRSRDDGPTEVSPKRTTPRSDVTETIFDRQRDFRRMRLNVGSTQSKDAEVLAGVMAELAGLERDDLGRIELKETHCFIEVSELYWKEFQDALHKQRWQDHVIEVRRA